MADTTARIVDIHENSQRIQAETTNALRQVLSQTQAQVGQSRLGYDGKDVAHWLRKVPDYNGDKPETFLAWIDAVERAAAEINHPNWTAFRIAKLKTSDPVAFCLINTKGMKIGRK